MLHRYIVGFISDSKDDLNEIGIRDGTRDGIHDSNHMPWRNEQR